MTLKQHQLTPVNVTILQTRINTYYNAYDYYIIICAMAIPFLVDLRYPDLFFQGFLFLFSYPYYFINPLFFLCCCYGSQSKLQ